MTELLHPRRRIRLRAVLSLLAGLGAYGEPAAIDEDRTHG